MSILWPIAIIFASFVPALSTISKALKLSHNVAVSSIVVVVVVVVVAAVVVVAVVVYA